MLTAQELLQTDFKQVFRGYNKEEVDAFVARIVKSYETLSREKTELEKENEKLKIALQQQKEKTAQHEHMMKQVQSEAVVLQEKYEQEAAERRQTMEQEAANMITEAQAEANRLIQSAQRAVGQLKQEEKTLRDRLRQLVEEGYELLSKFEEEQLDDVVDEKPPSGVATVRNTEEHVDITSEDTIPFARPEIAASGEEGDAIPFNTEN